MPMVRILSSAHARLRCASAASVLAPTSRNVSRRCRLRMVVAPCFLQHARLRGGFARQAPHGVQPGGTVGANGMSEINTSGLKARVIEAVNEHAKLAQVINDSLFSFGELGFHEYETSKYLTATLEEHGFAVQRGVAGMPTAWTARWGSGGPVIAIGSDTDAL